MSEQPEALRLADWLQANYEADGVDEAAAELRRLYALCEEMSEALEVLIDTVFTRGPRGKRALSALAKWKESK